jgi:hypothetical protein
LRAADTFRNKSSASAYVSPSAGFGIAKARGLSFWERINRVGQPVMPVVDDEKRWMETTTHPGFLASASCPRDVIPNRSTAFLQRA